MAPLPQNNTNRIFVDYQVGKDKHTLSWRFPGDPNAYGPVLTRIDALLDSMASQMYLTNIVAVRLQPAGSSISTPIAWTGNNSYGDGTIPEGRRPLELRWLGRSQDGRRMSISLYGTKAGTDNGFRLYTSVGGNIAAADAVLAAAETAGQLVTISGEPPEIYPYVDLNFNSYWEAEARA